MDAVILVAGRGERLRPLTNLAPKCLLAVAGTPILDRTLAMLPGLGIQKITLVTGYRSRQVEAYVRSAHPTLRVVFVRNTIYLRTNTLYSLWMARAAARGREFLLMDGDLIVEPKAVRRMLERRGNVVLCDNAGNLDSEAVKVYGDNTGRVERIGKEAHGRRNALGESIGLAKIDARTSRRLFAASARILRAGQTRTYYEAAFERAIEAGARFQALRIAGAKWVEIDTQADLRRARRMFNQG